MRIVFVAAAVLFVLFLSPSSCVGQSVEIRYVDPTGSDATGLGTALLPFRSLRKAYNNASAVGGSSIVLQVAAGEYQRLGQMTGNVNRNFTIIAQPGAFIECQGAAFPGIVYLNNWNAITISNLRIQNCRSTLDGGAVWVGGSHSLVLDGLTVQNCSSPGRGGGLAIQNPPQVGTRTVSVVRSTFRDCAGSEGGAIRSSQSNNVYYLLTITNSTFRGCVSTSNGGAINGGEVTISEGVFDGNAAGNDANRRDGGAIDFESGVNSVTDSTFTQNYADRGGAISTDQPAAISNCKFLSNIARVGGGVSTFVGGNRAVTLTDCVFRHNIATSGPSAIRGQGLTTGIRLLAENNTGGNTISGISIRDSTLRFNLVNSTGAALYLGNDNIATNLIIEWNTGVRGTGGVYMRGPRAVLRNSIVRHNTGLALAGGVFLTQGTGLLIDNSTITNNTGQLGGGLYQNQQNQASSTVLSSSISGNSAALDGGGVYATNAGSINFTRSSIDWNKAERHGGGMYIEGGNTQLHAGCTSVAENTAELEGGGLYFRNAGLANLRRFSLTGNRVLNVTASLNGASFYVEQTIVGLDRVSVFSNVRDTITCIGNTRFNDISKPPFVSPFAPSPCGCNASVGFDQCMLCGGTSSCIGGCDNKPYSVRTDCSGPEVGACVFDPQPESDEASTSAEVAGDVAVIVIGIVAGLCLLIVVMAAVILFVVRARRAKTDSAVGLPRKSADSMMDDNLDSDMIPPPPPDEPPSAHRSLKVQSNLVYFKFGHLSSVGPGLTMDDMRTTRHGDHFGAVEFIPIPGNGRELQPGDITIVRRLAQRPTGTLQLGKPNAKSMLDAEFVTVEQADHGWQRASIAHELAVLRSLPAHEHIVTFLGWIGDPASENIQIISSYEVLGNLASYLKRSPVDESMMANIGLQVAAAISFLHSNAICHRDISARNVVLGPQLLIKLGDLGQARSGGKELRRFEDALGPIRIMPPESLARREFCFASDVWSFGLLLAEIQTGFVPFDDMDPLQVAEELVGGKFDAAGRTTASMNRAATKAGSILSPALKSLVEGCLELNHDARPTISDVEQSLRQLQQQQSMSDDVVYADMQDWDQIDGIKSPVEDDDVIYAEVQDWF